MKKKKKKVGKGLKVKEFMCTKRSMGLKGPTALSWLNGITYYYCELLVRKLLVEVTTLPMWC